jgi:hypothetical protein
MVGGRADPLTRIVGNQVSEMVKTSVARPAAASSNTGYPLNRSAGCSSIITSPAHASAI